MTHTIEKIDRAYMLPTEAGKHMNMTPHLVQYHIGKKNLIAREMPLYTKCPYTGKMVYVTTKRLVEVDVNLDNIEVL